MLDVIFGSWILLVGIAILFRLGLFAAQKYWSQRLDDALVIFMVSVGGTISLLPVSAYIYATNTIAFTQTGLLWLTVSSIANAIAIIALIVALDTGELSIVGPLTSLGPLITAIVEPIIRTVIIPINVFLGAILTVIGAVVLSSNENTTQNITNNLKQKSAVLSLLVSVLYGFASISDAAGTQEIHPVIFSNLILLVMAIGSVLFLYYTHDNIRDPITNVSHGTLLIAATMLGLFQAGKMYWLFYGFSISPSGTHVAILLQIANVGIVIIGWLLFDEDHLLRRILGTIIIISGVSIAL